jgi:transposase InsO family protein
MVSGALANDAGRVFGLSLCFVTLMVLGKRRSWPTRRELTSEVFAYIETFYNTTRRHSTLGYLSPAQFETEPMTNNPKITG